MFRISKLTDYATVVLTELAARPTLVLSASDLARRARLELPTVSKLMKSLAQAGLVESFRGASGGYRLAQPASAISVADIITAIEGPIGVTECSAHAGLCDHEWHCAVRGNWQRVSSAVEQVLRGIRLTDMTRPQRAQRIHVQLATG
jgi:FeS assembly SUF system regulator